MTRSQTQQVTAGLLAAVLASLVMWYAYKQFKNEPLDEIESAEAELLSRKLDTGSPEKSAKSIERTETPQVSNTSTGKNDEKSLHNKIEELDKRGKALFRNKQFLEAAHAFTEALDLIEAHGGSSGSSSLTRQVLTLTNNRSAMYEKGGLPDLALEDCRTILEQDVAHSKARLRALRVLESQKRYREALVEVCALQLRFLQENREKLRLGIPVNPPVPQSKLEDLMQHLLPQEIEQQLKIEHGPRPLPSKHTILQLLRSFTGYNSWMAAAAKNGSAESISSKLEKVKGEQHAAIAQRASLLFRRGQRHAFDNNFDKAEADFEEALKLVDANTSAQDDMPEDDFARLLEWSGMVRHWRYNLDGALQCYERCSDLEPTNAGILVKRAGVKMDGGNHDEALTLFDTALGLDSEAVDALLHRGNLRMMQQKIPEAKADLERCLELRPDHVLARLRLASILMASNDLDGAKKALEFAEKADPNSSEVHSYRGEMHFAQGEFAEARAQFDKAIACEPGNPTPYVNAALAIMNTPGAGGGPPDVADAITMLETAIQVDPQFHAAYVHLGQLKLSLATDLTAAREVIGLYDQGLEYCRTAEELKDICSMRLLTVAQVEAATELKMETLNMQ